MSDIKRSPKVRSLIKSLDSCHWRVEELKHFMEKAYPNRFKGTAEYTRMIDAIEVFLKYGFASIQLCDVCTNRCWFDIS